METRTLRMIFGLSSGKEWVLSLSNPRTDLTEGEVTAAMQAIIDSDLFLVGPDMIVRAEVVSRNVTEVVA